MRFNPRLFNGEVFKIGISMNKNNAETAYEMLTAGIYYLQP